MTGIKSNKDYQEKQVIGESRKKILESQANKYELGMAKNGACNILSQRKDMFFDQILKKYPELVKQLYDENVKLRKEILGE